MMGKFRFLMMVGVSFYEWSKILCFFMISEVFLSNFGQSKFLLNLKTQLFS